MSAGGMQFLNGGSIPAGPTSNGQLITYQFLKSGRYLVICMNRVHFLNDWMFGFVNVQGRRSIGGSQAAPLRRIAARRQCSAGEGGIRVGSGARGAGDSPS